MKPLINRLSIGLAGLFIFWAFGMLSANELAKTGVLMTVSIMGLTGILILGRPKIVWLSRASIAIYLLFFLDTAIKGFLRDYFGLRPNPAIVLQALLNTSSGETNEFFLHNWRDITQAFLAFCSIFLIAILAEHRLYRTERHTSFLPTSRGGHIAVSTMLTLFIALHFNPTMAKENPVLVWPLRYVEYQNNLAHVASMAQDITRNMAHRSEWKVQYAGPSKNTVVWVIGESVNRVNLSLYDYPRRTTPKLDAMRGDLVVFNDVVSSEATTMGSLMNMMTPANLKNPDAWSKQPDVLMLAKEAGYKTFWISNHAPNDWWLGLVSNHANDSTFINQGAGRGENNIDGNLAPHVNKALADSAPKKLIVVHLLGAHPTYDMRYPKAFSRFDGLDDIVSSSMKDAGRSLWIRHMRDEYDNAILYGDDVLANLIESTKKRSVGNAAALLYSADHGQEVGHTRNHAGHSAVDKSGYEIPMLLWNNASGGFAAGQKKLLEKRPYQTDHLNHTMLGLLRIQTKYYDPNHDVLSDRFIPAARTINGQPYAPDQLRHE